MRRGLVINLYGIAMMIGMVLLLVGILGYTLGTNPFLAKFPYIGENIQWAHSHFYLLLLSGIFLLSMGLFMSPILAFVVTIIAYVMMIVMGVVPW